MPVIDPECMGTYGKAGEFYSDPSPQTQIFSSLTSNETGSRLRPDSGKIQKLMDEKKAGVLIFMGLPAFQNCFEYGGSCRIRTYDQLVKSQLLYQLS